jgi:voltage-gated potassium channel
VMLIGYGIIAVPTGIVTVEMVRSRDEISQTPCPSCRRTGHDEDAQFCKYCGSNLSESEIQFE